jgi:hypothetical protein
LASVLKQHEEEWRDDDRPTPRQRDFRAENARQGHFRPRPAGPASRAYVAQGDAETDDEEKQVRFLDEVEEYEATLTQALVIQDPREEDVSSPDPTMTPDQVSNLVFRAMESSGRRPPNSGGAPPRPRPNANPVLHSPRRENPDQLEFCPECRTFGHRPENGWAEITCGRCHRVGHPKRACKVLPCKKCNEFDDGRCNDWKMLGTMKKLALQGSLDELPKAVQDWLHESDTSSGEKPLNQ